MTGFAAGIPVYNCATLNPRPYLRSASTHRLYLAPSWYSTQSPAAERGSLSSHANQSTCFWSGTDPSQLSYRGMTCSRTG